MGLEKTLESPLGCKEIKSVNPKGNQSWMFIGRADAEAPILWPLYAKNWLIRKNPDAGKDWKQKEKGTTEDEMVGIVSPTRWTWVWASPGSWSWTGKPGVLQSTGSQRVGHDWVTELNWNSQCTQCSCCSDSRVQLSKTQAKCCRPGFACPRLSVYSYN